MRRFNFYGVFSLLILIFCTPAFAEVKTFIKEYTYQASDFDSRISSRTIALEQVKRLLLEELGTYLEGSTEVKNFQLTRDKIVALTAGIVQTQIGKMGSDFVISLFCFWGPRPNSFPTNYMIKCPGK